MGNDQDEKGIKSKINPKHTVAVINGVQAENSI